VRTGSAGGGVHVVAGFGAGAGFEPEAAGRSDPGDAE
jgi:hypothetical protein